VAETIIVLLAVFLWGLSPRRGDLREAAQLALVAIGLLGAALHYAYVALLPTDKLILPFIIVEGRGGYSVAYPDLGQFLVALAIVEAYRLANGKKRSTVERGEAESASAPVASHR